MLLFQVWRSLQSLWQDLHKSLSARGSGLYVARGKPQDVLQKLLKHESVKLLVSGIVLLQLAGLSTQ